MEEEGACWEIEKIKKPGKTKAQGPKSNEIKNVQFVIYGFFIKIFCLSMQLLLYECHQSHRFIGDWFYGT